MLSCCARRCSCKAVCLGILNLTISYLFTCLTSGQSLDAFFADTTVVTRALAMALDSCLTRILRTSESLHLAVVIAAVILLHLTILMLQRWKKVKCGQTKNPLHALFSVKIKATAFPLPSSASTSPRIQAGHRSEFNSAAADLQNCLKPAWWRLVYNCTMGRAMEAACAIFFCSTHSEIAALRAQLAACQAEQQQSNKLYAKFGFTCQELRAICRLMRCLSKTLPLPEVIEILSHLTPEALKALQKPPVAIAELQKALSSSDSRIAKLDKALTASKKSNVGVDKALASARAQIAILEDRLSTANSSKAKLQAEWQTSRKQKQQLCKLLAEKE